MIEGDATWNSAIYEVAHERCPRHVLDLPINPDATDPRDDEHASELARDLTDAAKELVRILDAFPGSQLMDEDTALDDTIER